MNATATACDEFIKGMNEILGGGMLLYAGRA
jgi:hypothetical protein